KKWTWHSEIYFNDAWEWTDDGAAADAEYDKGLSTGGLVDLETVALHELGHAVGLGHEDDGQKSVMASFYGGTQRTLFPDDVDGIIALYSGGGGGGKGGGKGGGNGGGKGKPDRFSHDDFEWVLTGVTLVGDGYAVPSTVPEPATMIFLSIGGTALVLRRRRN
ncbi:hypothetical protein LCGC14_2280980, partial [marine sediment metagenome]